MRGSLYDTSAFLPSLESVLRDPAARDARAAAFKADAIPLDAERKTERRDPAPAIVGALHPRTTTKPIRQRPEHVEEAIDAAHSASTTEESMATPQMPEDHAAAIEALKTALPATRQEIFAAVPWYAETNSRKAALSKDLRAIGASAPERGGVWAIGGAKANRARRVEKRAVTSETSGLPDVRSLPSEYLAECMREVNRRLREVEVLRSVLEAA